MTDLEEVNLAVDCLVKRLWIERGSELHIVKWTVNVQPSINRAEELQMELRVSF